MRYKVTLAYDGTNFAGFQRQPNQRTVESELTRVVNKMAKMPTPAIVIYGSGRTDAGVHALGQVVHFDFPFPMKTENMRKGLNSMLPVDMEVLKVSAVSDQFHARYDVSGKRYVYRMDLGEFRNPFKRHYTGHWKFPVDLKKIRTALNDLIGEHDFTSFVASGSSARTNYRTIYEPPPKSMKFKMSWYLNSMGMVFYIIKCESWLASLLKLVPGPGLSMAFRNSTGSMTADMRAERCQLAVFT